MCLDVSGRTLADNELIHCVHEKLENLFISYSRCPGSERGRRLSQRLSDESNATQRHERNNAASLCRC